MEADFWLDKWHKQEIGFHQETYNDLMVRHFSKLDLKSARRVFVPLCGKTRDIQWLLDQGFQVIGAELSPLAIDALFQNLGLIPTVEEKPQGLFYHNGHLQVWVGDIFDLGPDDIGAVDALYDRAALVALPPDLRRCYSAHLITLSRNAAQLLLTFEYDQSLKDGPPFSIPDAFVHEYYHTSYSLKCLEKRPVKGGLKGQIPASEACWLLR